MKKISLLIVTALFAFTNGAWAQNDNDDTEITVTNQKGEKEVIDLPEALSYEYDSLLSVYNAKTYIRPNANCDMPDVNPIYEKEVYKERLSRIPAVIEMPYNDVVQKLIDRYSGHLRRSVSLMLGTQNFYMPIFEQALESYGLPLELKYLPVIESALNPNAVSRVGATGLWQFMLHTGKQYGLEINSLVDERRDPVKASYAAAHYLSDLYKIFGDWNLVIAAYNCGPQGINKAIHRAKGLTDYWDIYPYLPKETRGYVPAFIAANYIMNYYCDHNICPLTTKELPAATDTVMVDRDMHFEQIAQVLDISVEQLKSLNPQYRRDIVNGQSGYASLRLPSSLIPVFIDKEDSICAASPKNYKPKRTEVEVAGGSDNYSVNDNKVTYEAAEADEQKTTAKKTHQRSESSSKKSSRKGKGKKKSKKHTRKAKNVSVREGDTLSEIAERNHTTVSKLKKLNKISGSNIRAGKKIRVK